MIWIFLIIILFVLILGSYTDIKTREVPDWLNFGLIFVGVGLHAILSASTNSWLPLIYSLVGLGIGMGVAFGMYYLGQWGGGDAKMMMGLGAVIGFDFQGMFILSFLLNVFILGAVYGLCYGAGLAISKGRRFSQTFRKLYYDVPGFVRIAVLVLLGLFLVIGALIVFLFQSILLIYIISLIITLIAMFYLYLFAKSVETCCMLKWKNPSELTEGDWIAKDIKINGKYVCGPKDLGILKHQINKLKKAKVKKILIKEGIPFVPSFLISFVVTLFLGNIFLLLFSIL